MNVIDELPKGKDCNVTFEEFLASTNLSLDRYILAISSSVKKTTVFIRRQPCEVRVNAYNPLILLLWKANMDIQYIVDIYAVAKYIASYIAKPNKGMSETLAKVCKESDDVEIDSIKKLRSIGSAFVRASELTAQEAAVLLIRQPLLYSSRSVVFINTNELSKRGYVIKPFSQIQQLPDESTEITMGNFQKRYPKRPAELKRVCLADWMSLFNPLSSKNSDWYNKSSEEHLCHGDSEEEDDEIPAAKFALSDGTFVRRVSNVNRRKIIRYVRFSILSDRENHFRELLMLFYPFCEPDESDILGSFPTFEDKYASVIDVVEENRKVYEYWRGDIEKAREELLVEHDLEEEINIAPNSRHLDEQDVVQGETIVSDASVAVEALEYRLPDCVNDDDFFNDVCQLNESQEMFFLEFVSREKRRLYEDLPPCVPFLSGAAGTGKSHLTKCLYQSLIRVFRSVHVNDSKPTVGIVAYTALAAYNIMGTTIHSFLGLKFGANPSNVLMLSPDTLNTYRCQLIELRVLIIDEISFVGSNFLYCIDMRLRMIKGLDQPFGGVSTLFIGDLFQLQPVRDGMCFAPPRSKGVLYSNIVFYPWQLVEVFELTEVVRQKERSWCELLLRLREGNQTDEDISRLKKLVNNNIPSGAPRACRLNERVVNHNSTVLSKCTSLKVTCVAHDIVKGDLSGKNDVADRILFLARSMPVVDTSGLYYTLDLAESLPYMITTNVCKSDGLLNGAIGIMKKVTFVNEKPILVWMAFPNEITGARTRRSFSNIYPDDVQAGYTPIRRVVLEFNVKQSTSFKSSFVVERKQFPLVLASAMSIHKTQGKDMYSLELDFKTTVPVDALHYVGLSRCKSEFGNCIIDDLYDHQISTSKKVIIEMERLRNHSSLNFSLTFPHTVSCDKIIFHNIQSLHKNMKYVQESLLYKHCGVVVLCETWLDSSDNTNDYQLNEFQLHRFDYSSVLSRPHAGMVVYTAQSNQSAVVSNQIVNGVQFVTVCTLGVSLLAIHRRQTDTSERSFLHALASVLVDRFDVIVGDVNINVSSGDHWLAAFLATKGYQRRNERSTTDGNTTLDVVFTRNCGSVATLESVFSYHKPILITLS